jgi:acetylglutamate kinase
VIYRQNRRLVEALEARSIRTRGIQHGVFHCGLLDRDRLGLVGEVDSVDLESVHDAVSAGALPVVACLGESPSGQVLNVNADIAARELVWAVKPHKVIFITPTGGLLDRDGRIISAVSLDTDYEGLMSQPWVHSGMRLKLQQVRELLDPLPHSASVAMTSADHLTRELFTHGGAGTLIRRGEAIESFGDWTPALRERVTPAIETAFQRRLLDSWLDDDQVHTVLIASSGRAAAVVLEGTGGVPYLDKFAVTPEARGEGLGAALWQSLRSRFPRLYWRSRSANPINGWYFQQADSCRRRGAWVVFCSGVDDVLLEHALVEDALSRDPGWEAVDP